MPSRTYSVVLFEPNNISRRNLEFTFSSYLHFRLIASFQSLSDLQIKDHLKPQLTIVSPDGLGGTSALDRIANWWPSSKLIVLTPTVANDILLAYLTQGVRAVLMYEADEPTPKLLNAMMDVMTAGLAVIDDRFIDQLKVLRTPSKSQNALNPSLSDREHDVLSLVVSGFTDKEIGDLLGISFSTVSSHVRHIEQKLDVQTRSALVYKAAIGGFMPSRIAA